MKRQTILIIVSVTIIAIFFSFIQLSRANTDALSVYFFDVGQGDSTLIRTPEGTDILVDGGKGTKVLEELGRVLPFWDRHLDMIILTHPDADHINGIADVLGRYAVDQILDAGFTKTLTSYDKIKTIAQERGVAWMVADDNRDFLLDSDIMLDILHPDQETFAQDVHESNDASIIFRLSYGDIDFLMTADAGMNIESLLVDETIASEFLHVGHHGSRYSSGETFLRAVSPLVSMISVGTNSYGHPHPDVLERLNAIGTKVVRTDTAGTIVVKVEDDGQWTMQCERECG